VSAAALVPLRTAVRACLDDLPPGSLVLVALSGGPDSAALAAAAGLEAPRRGWRAGAVVVDHALQPGSADVAEAAAALGRRLGLDPVVVERVEVAAGPGAGGPEAAARDARYLALAAVADRLAASAVLLGHTLDDQAETVLLGLARGSGARSLSGMAPVAGRYRRPLLGLRRGAVRAAAAGLPTADDPHNADPRYARARVRHDALPTLEAALGPGVAEALARSAALLRADADTLDALADEALGALRATRSPHADGVGVEVVGGLPEGVRTRVLRRLAIEAGVPAGRLTREHVLALDRLVADPRTAGPVALPAGVEAVRSYGRLRLRRCGTEPPPAEPSARQE
jgi:tRNA(Ile)-lysidine synthase